MGDNLTKNEIRRRERYEDLIKRAEGGKIRYPKGWGFLGCGALLTLILAFSLFRSLAVWPAVVCLEIAVATAAVCFWNLSREVRITYDVNGFTYRRGIMKRAQRYSYSDIDAARGFDAFIMNDGKTVRLALFKTDEFRELAFAVYAKENGWKELPRVELFGRSGENISEEKRERVERYIAESGKGIFSRMISFAAGKLGKLEEAVSGEKVRGAQAITVLLFLLIFGTLILLPIGIVDTFFATAGTLDEYRMDAARDIGGAERTEEGELVFATSEGEFVVKYGDSVTDGELELIGSAESVLMRAEKKAARYETYYLVYEISLEGGDAGEADLLSYREYCGHYRAVRGASPLLYVWLISSAVFAALIAIMLAAVKNAEHLPVWLLELVFLEDQPEREAKGKAVRRSLGGAGKSAVGKKKRDENGGAWLPCVLLLFELAKYSSSAVRGMLALLSAVLALYFYLEKNKKARVLPRAVGLLLVGVYIASRFIEDSRTVILITLALLVVSAVRFVLSRFTDGRGRGGTVEDFWFAAVCFVSLISRLDRVFSVHGLRGSPYFGVVLAITAVLCALIALTLIIRHRRERVGAHRVLITLILCPIVAVILFFSVNAVLDSVNYAFDRSEGVVLVEQVERKYVSHIGTSRRGRTSRHEVLVTVDGVSRWFRLPRKEYDGIEVGDGLMLTRYSGGLGEEYYVVEKQG